MPTHFERVTKDPLRYQPDGVKFAAEAIQQEHPSHALHAFVQETKQKMPNLRSQAEVIKEVLPLNHRAGAYCHCLIMELMRRSKHPYSFHELAQGPDLGTAVSIVTATKDLATINTAAHMHYQMAAHAMAGKRVYDVSPGLAEQLHHTELRGLQADDLSLPHKSIYLKVPPAADLKVWNDLSDWHKVVGIYITEDEGDEVPSWRFLVCGEPKPKEIFPGYFDDNDALVYFEVDLPPGLPLDEAIARNKKRTEEVVEEMRIKDEDSFRNNEKIWEGIFRWAMNVVLYQALDGAEQEDVITNKEVRQLRDRIEKLPPKSKKRTKLSGRLRGKQAMHHTILGKSLATTSRGGWELRIGIRVRGHWRNQPHGPGRMYRRLQWIEPFWKGPPLAATAHLEQPNAPEAT